MEVEERQVGEEEHKQNKKNQLKAFITTDR